ncbi:MAG: polymer-forming cytoskeletal protein [Myxococcota bacterium]
MSSRDLTPAPGEISALLGHGTQYSGKLTFEGRVRIDGEFEGTIFSDDMLIVGDGATVRGEIRVGTLIVLGGSIEGNVRARELVELHAPSEVHGDIETPHLFIDRGARFEGQCRMGDGTPSQRHPLDGAIAEALEGSGERLLPDDAPEPARAPASEDDLEDFPAEGDLGTRETEEE